MADTYRTGDIWPLFGERHQAAATAVNRAASAAGFPHPGSGARRRFTANEVAGLLAVYELGIGGTTVPTPEATAIFDIVTHHDHGFIIGEYAHGLAVRNIKNPEWTEQPGDWLLGGPVIIVRVAHFHGRVCKFPGSR